MAGGTLIPVMLPKGPATLWLPDSVEFEGEVLIRVETSDGDVVAVPVSRSLH
jgi:hypothetical protein